MCIRTESDPVCKSLPEDLQGVIYTFLRITGADHIQVIGMLEINLQNNGNFQQDIWNVKWLVFDSVHGEFVATSVWIMYLVTFARPRSISRGWGQPSG